MTSSAGRLLPVVTGAGCRNVEVGALPTFRGVKCCCNVLNAGRATFLDSSFVVSRGFACGRESSTDTVAAGGRVALLVPSGLVTTLAERLKPAKRADVRDLAGSGIAGLLVAYAGVLEEMCIDLGLSPVVLGLVVLLLASATVLFDGARA